MKINLPQLEQHLAKTLSKIYLIYGEEPFLVQEALNLIRQKAKAQGFEDRVRLDIETESDLENGYTQAYSLPLLSQQRLLELHWKGKLTQAGQQFLKNYAAQPSPHCMLIVNFNKLDARTEQSAWFKAVEENAIIVPIWPLFQKQFPSWITQKAKTYSLQLTPGANQALAHYTESNPAAAAQELEKLSLLGNTVIDEKTIATFVSDQACYTAFDLVNQALSGQASQTLRILRYLKNEGSEPLLILGAFTFELRAIEKIAKDVKKGGSLNQLFSQYRIRQNKQSPIRDFLKRHDDQSLLHLFILAGEIDRLAKGAIPGDIWFTLERFSLRVAGIALGNDI